LTASSSSSKAVLGSFLRKKKVKKKIDYR
jgi:hypothetical protein